jgi:hypothetical protein
MGGRSKLKLSARVKDLDREMSGSEVIRIEETGEFPRIRLYCSQSGVTWNLQIRANLRLKSRYGVAKGFYIATAPLSEDDMRALRDKIDAYLDEAAELSHPSRK